MLKFEESRSQGLRISYAFLCIQLFIFFSLYYSKILISLRMILLEGNIILLINNNIKMHLS